MHQSRRNIFARTINYNTVRQKGLAAFSHTWAAQLAGKRQGGRVCRRPGFILQRTLGEGGGVGNLRARPGNFLTAGTKLRPALRLVCPGCGVWCVCACGPEREDRPVVVVEPPPTRRIFPEEVTWLVGTGGAGGSVAAARGATADSWTGTTSVTTS